MYQETDRESIEQWESDIANSQIVFFFVNLLFSSSLMAITIIISTGQTV